MSRGLFATVVIAAVVVILVIVGLAFFQRVPPGTVGILVDYGEGTTTGQPSIKPVMPGRWYFVGPLQDLQSYPFSQQSLIMVRRTDEGTVKGDDSVDCKDDNGIQLNVDTTVIWKIDPARAHLLYLNYPRRDIDEIRELLVRRLAREAVADACGKFGFIEIAGTGRVAFSDKVTEYLGPTMTDDYLELIDVSIGEVYLLPDQQKAITDKSVAEQKALQAKFLEAQKEAEARALVQEAEGDKKAKVIRAEGDAEAARIITEQLGGRDQYLYFLWIQKWNGVVSLFSGSQQGPIVQLPGSILPTPSATAPGQ